MRDEGSGSKKNQSLVAYDITSLSYNQTLAGQTAKYDDDMGTLSCSGSRHAIFFLILFTSYFSYLQFVSVANFAPTPSSQRVIPGTSEFISAMARPPPFDIAEFVDL